MGLRLLHQMQGDDEHFGTGKYPPQKRRRVDSGARPEAAGLLQQLHGHVSSPLQGLSMPPSNQARLTDFPFLSNSNPLSLLGLQAMSGVPSAATNPWLSNANFEAQLHRNSIHPELVLGQLRQERALYHANSPVPPASILSNQAISNNLSLLGLRSNPGMSLLPNMNEDPSRLLASMARNPIGLTASQLNPSVEALAQEQRILALLAQRAGSRTETPLDLSVSGRRVVGSGGEQVAGIARRSSPVSKEQVPSKPSLPPKDGLTPPYPQRVCVPLATDEDPNWLSEFLCFVRSDLVEVFRASKDDVRSRNTSKKVRYGQVGIRCRFCAHLPQAARANRSSSYPSSLSRIYQSLTMMLRDHFGSCSSIPPDIKRKYFALKGKTAQGATDSKQFWVYSAKKIGLMDSDNGIWVDENSDKESASEEPSYRAAQGEKVATAKVSAEPVMLVKPEDRPYISEFLYELMTHAQLVHLEESEKTGNRKGLPDGLPGIGCLHCCQDNRKGLCRLFPVRKKTLPDKIDDLFEHVRRCSLCPPESQERLLHLKRLDHDEVGSSRKKQFYERVWTRMWWKVAPGVQSAQNNC